MAVGNTSGKNGLALSICDLMVCVDVSFRESVIAQC